jgi:hypothetical protein
MRDHPSSVVGYDPNTGKFVWLKNRGGKAIAGAEAGTKHSRGYIEINVLGRRWLAHRLAWFMVYGHEPEGQIDHINGVRSDNRIANLRDVDASDNQSNRHGPAAHNSCGYLGVEALPSGAFAARVTKRGQRTYLGTFAAPDEAHGAYLAARAQ